MAEMPAYEQRFLDWVRQCSAKTGNTIAQDVIDSWLAWYRFLYERMPELNDHEDLTDSPEMRERIRTIGKEFIDTHENWYHAASEVAWAARRWEAVNRAEQDLRENPDDPETIRFYNWFVKGRPLRPTTDTGGEK